MNVGIWVIDLAYKGEPLRRDKLIRDIAEGYNLVDVASGYGFGLRDMQFETRHKKTAMTFKHVIEVTFEGRGELEYCSVFWIPTSTFWYLVWEKDWSELGRYLKERADEVLHVHR